MNIYQKASLFLKFSAMSEAEAARILGVSLFDSDDKINKAYKKLVFEVHPDRNPNGIDKNIELNIARDTLLKPSNIENVNARAQEEIDDYLNHQQTQADAWLDEIRRVREEWTDFCNGKLKFEELKEPYSIELAQKGKEREKEYKKQQRLNKKKKHSI